MDQENRKGPLHREKQKILNREMSGISIRAVEGEERTCELTFSSEEPYSRFWGVEILDHSEGCVDLERLNSTGCLLFIHNRDRVIGRVRDAGTDGSRCHARVLCDTDEASETIYQKVQCKTLKGTSVGYVVDSWEEVMPGKRSADGRFTGPCDIARKWVPFEISVVSVPADPTVGVGRGLGNREDFADSGRMLDYYSRQLQINRNRGRKGGTSGWEEKRY